MFEKTYNLDNLYKAWLKVKKVSHWKEGTQRYEEDVLFHLTKLSRELQNHTAKLGNALSFTIIERGKKRRIYSYDLDTRIAVRSFIDNVLFPKIKTKLIYDNGASIKDKGLKFHRSRLKCHLDKYYREHGNKGYILLADFKKFFDNIDHVKLKSMFAKILQDKESEKFTNVLIDTYRTDISCLDIEEINSLKSAPFDSVKFYSEANLSSRDKSLFLERGVFIGGQLSQIAGIFYPHELDNFIKIVCSIKYYGRYMDDFYIIHNDKKFLKNLLEKIKIKCKELGIFLNEKKTQIVSLGKPFTICKIQYFVKEDGDVIQKPCKESFTRERKAIRRFEKDLKLEASDFSHIKNSYLSWRGNLSKFDCKRSIISIDEYFIKRISPNLSS